MKVKLKVAKIYEPKEGENLKGAWKLVDAVLRNDEKYSFENGETADVKEFVAIRVRGTKVDDFLREVREGDTIEAEVRFNCEERISKGGNMYLQNDMVFSCPAWKVVC